MDENLDRGDRGKRQGRKASPLRQSNVVRRSRPLPPPENLEYCIDGDTGIVGLVAAPPGTTVQRLGRDGGLIGEPLVVIGFVTFKTFRHAQQEFKLWVRPVCGHGVVSVPYALIEPE